MKILKTLAVFAACVSFGVGASVVAAELPLPKDLPPYGADKPVPVPKIDKHTLSNGMTVWIVADAEGVLVSGTRSNWTPGASTTRSQYSVDSTPPVEIVTFQLSPSLSSCSMPSTRPLTCLMPYFFTSVP